MNRNELLIALPTNMPTNQREWSRFIRVLSEVTLKIKDGRVFDGSVLPQSVVGNRGSVQNIIPITAVDAGSDASINIAAHTVTYDFGSVTYNSGSITGLAYSTTYYVYASDPAFAGGAVTYLATTDPADVVSDPGNYYVGGVICPPPAQSGAGITRVSSTATTTLASHGHLSGSDVVVSGAVETEYNGTFTISNVSTNTFDYTVSGTPATPATGTITVASGGVGGGGGGGGGSGEDPEDGEQWR